MLAMNTIIIPLLLVLDVALSLYMWAVIISVVVSWLVAFNIINIHNQFVRMIGGAFQQVTEPALRRIRSLVPISVGMDFSPVILLLIIYFLRQVLYQIRLYL